MIIAIALVLHFIADFLLQSREMGKNKSSNNTYLFKHISIIFAVIFIGLIPFLGLKLAFVVAFYNALIHAIIDKFIWNIYKLSAHYRIKKEVHELQAALRAGGVMYSADEEQAAYQMKVQNWQYWEDHWFYATIGFDQLLHALTIVALITCLV